VDHDDRMDEPVQSAPHAAAEPTRGGRAVARAAVDPRAALAHGIWQASSFDLAQGLDVKVMQSKLSPETLDRLFRG
jgi:hypothetical protein